MKNEPKCIDEYPTCSATLWPFCRCRRRWWRPCRTSAYPAQTCSQYPQGPPPAQSLWNTIMFMRLVLNVNSKIGAHVWSDSVS